MVTDTKVKTGYKQTEIGAIPVEWELYKLGEECELITKGTTPTSLGRSYSSSGINFIKIESLDTHGNFLPNNIEHIDETTDKLLKRSRLKQNDILFSIAGALGRVALVEKRILPANTNQALAIARLKKDSKLNNRYVLYFLKSSTIQNHIKSISVQGAQANLSLQNINDLPIAVPSTIEEQLAITNVMEDIDIILSKLDQLIEKKRNIKQGTMQELLTGKRRLPGFSGEWEEKHLGEIAEFYKGKALFKAELSENGMYKCIHYGELFTKYEEEIDEIYSHTDKIEGAFTSKSNDVLMPTSDVTPNGLATASCIKEDGVILGGDVLVIRPDDSLNGTFLSYNITIDKPQVMRLVSGTTVYHLYASDMRKFQMRVPGTEEQGAIVNILNDMQHEIDDLVLNRNKYLDIKQGMMQQLLTGRIRLV